MPTPRDLVLARLATTRAQLDEVVGRLDQGMMMWAPRPGMRTIAGQLVEVAGTELQILARLQGGVSPTDDEVRAMIGAHEELPLLQAFLLAVRTRTLAYLQGLSETELSETVPIEGWHESIGLPEMPRAEVFNSIGQHEAYHTGQLVSYLWARGDDPYEW